MIVEIKAHAKSSRNEIILKEKEIHVYVREAPEKSKANKAIQKLLSQYFNCAPSKVEIIKGVTSKTKKFKIKS